MKTCIFLFRTSNILFKFLCQFKFIKCIIYLRDLDAGINKYHLLNVKYNKCKLLYKHLNSLSIGLLFFFIESICMRKIIHFIYLCQMFAYFIHSCDCSTFTFSFFFFAFFCKYRYAAHKITLFLSKRIKYYYNKYTLQNI